MTCERAQVLMVEALYGELEGALAQELEAHLSGCAACAASFEEMRATGETMREYRRPEPGEEFWNQYYERLETRMDRERSVVDGAPIAARRRSYVSWGYRVAAAVAVLAAGVWIGRSSLTGNRTGVEPTVATHQVPSDSSANPGLHAEDTTAVASKAGKQSPGPIDGSRGNQNATPGNVKLASADVRAHEYIERSQVLLLALVNATPDSGSVEFDQRRARAGDLVREAAVLRDDLPGSDNRRLRELVTDLQMILREIANLESKNDLDAVQIIRNRVDREGVLLQIDVQQMRNDSDSTKAQPKKNGAID